MLYGASDSTDYTRSSGCSNSNGRLRAINKWVDNWRNSGDGIRCCDTGMWHEVGDRIQMLGSDLGV
jgi:hypothetical protein